MPKIDVLRYSLAGFFLFAGILQGHVILGIFSAVIFGLYFYMDNRRDIAIEKYINDNDIKAAMVVTKSENIKDRQMEVEYESIPGNPDTFGTKSESIFHVSYSLDRYNRLKDIGALRTGIGSVQYIVYNGNNRDILGYNVSSYEAVVQTKFNDTLYTLFSGAMIVIGSLLLACIAVL